YLVSYRGGGTVPGDQREEVGAGVEKITAAAAPVTSALSPAPGLAEARLPPLTLADANGPALPDPHWGNQTLDVANPYAPPGARSHALSSGQKADVANPSVAAAWPDTPWGDPALDVADPSLPAAWSDTPWGSQTPDVAVPDVPAIALPGAPWGDESQRMAVPD